MKETTLENMTRATNSDREILTEGVEIKIWEYQVKEYIYQISLIPSGL